MNVGGAGSMEQMQMRKMDGTGGGHGKGGGGMRDIMQSLSTEDQATIKETLSAMTPEERSAKVSEMKTVNSTTMDAEEYTQALLDILIEDTANEAQTDGFSVYA